MDCSEMGLLEDDRDTTGGLVEDEDDASPDAAELRMGARGRRLTLVSRTRSLWAVRIILRGEGKCIKLDALQEPSNPDDESCNEGKEE